MDAESVSTEVTGNGVHDEEDEDIDADDVVLIDHQNDGDAVPPNGRMSSVVLHDDDDDAEMKQSEMPGTQVNADIGEPMEHEQEQEEDAAVHSHMTAHGNGVDQPKLLEGYCLVFLRELEYQQLEVVDLATVGDEQDKAMMPEMCALRNIHGIQNDNDKALCWARKPDIADQEFEEKVPKRLKGCDSNNLLRGLNSAHIQYKIVFSRPSMDRPDEDEQINPNDEAEGKYVYVIIWMDELYMEAYADFQNVAVLINREEAIRAGRQFDEFQLAHRTHLPSDDELDYILLSEENAMETSTLARNKIDDDSEQQLRQTGQSVYVQGFGSGDWDVKQNTAIEHKMSDRIAKLPLSVWNNIHIPFEYSIKADAGQRSIYELYPSANNPNYQTVVTHRLYLRILYSCLVDDRSMKGADFLHDYHAKNKWHPFVTMFTLHEYDNAKFFPLRNPKVPLFVESLFRCAWIRAPVYANLVDDIREYYGEYIAFYYAFLMHYVQSMLPMVVIGAVWFIVQLSSARIDVGGGTFFVLIAVLWSTVLIEVWYRKEAALRFKWGMCRYHETEVPRPTFTGKVVVSEYNGDIIEDHRNILRYWLRIFFSLSTMVFCIAIVLTLVGSIWILKRKWKDDAGYKIAIGVINSVQIKIFNVLYTKLAFALNEFEQHRLVEDYYNALVIKRIIFMVVNSFNSLYYIAFVDNTYDDNEQRLESLRIQLFTLFATSIVVMNLLEVLVPKIPEYIRRFKARRKQKKTQETEDMDAEEDDGNVQTKKGVETAISVAQMSGDEWHLAVVDPDGEFNDDRYTGGLDVQILLDVEQQLQAPKLPSTLDNVAEIVILHGYIVMFVVVFPLMPLLAYINAIFEVRIDLYNLTQSQRPVPLGADGLGVWRAVLSVFNTISIFSNMAVITWVTDLPQIVLHLTFSNQIIWYFVICLCILCIMISVRLALPNESYATKKAMARQQQCETLVTLLQDSSPNKDRSKVGQKKQLIAVENVQNNNKAP